MDSRVNAVGEDYLPSTLHSYRQQTSELDGREIIRFFYANLFALVKSLITFIVYYFTNTLCNDSVKANLLWISRSAFVVQ